jgi:hypothetical protein
MTTTAAVPLTVMADDRERSPWTFSGLGETYVVRRRLPAGGYTLPFCAARLAVCRKGLDDLYRAVLGTDARERFEWELRRLDLMEQAVVVVGGQLTEPPPGRTAGQLAVVRARVEGYRRRWPVVDWVFLGGRRGGEIYAYAWLMAARERLAREEAHGLGV